MNVYGETGGSVPNVPAQLNQAVLYGPPPFFVVQQAIRNLKVTMEFMGRAT